MADKTFGPAGSAIERFSDMGDGSFARVVAAVSPNTAAVTVTIANGASLSNAIDLGAARAGSIITPAAWTAASLTVLVSHDGVTYSSLYDDTDTEWAIATANMATGRARTLPLTTFLPYRYLKFRSGTAALAVNQGAERVMYLVAN